jgi:DNA-binding XRE family transcriptional regulator
MTQRELADAVGVAPSTISRLEAGSMACTLLLVARIAIHLGGIEIGRQADLGGAVPADLVRPAWRRHR